MAASLVQRDRKRPEGTRPALRRRCTSSPRRDDWRSGFKDVGIKAPDTENSVVGPPLSAARDDKGQWTKAAEGFARKQGLSPDDLSVVEEQGVERIAAHVSVKGAKAADVMPEHYRQRRIGYTHIEANAMGTLPG